MDGHFPAQGMVPSEETYGKRRGKGNNPAVQPGIIGGIAGIF